MCNNDNLKKLQFTPYELFRGMMRNDYTIVVNTWLVPKKHRGDKFIEFYETKKMKAQFSSKKMIKNNLKAIAHQRLPFDN